VDDQSDGAAGAGVESSDGAGAQASGGEGSGEADGTKKVRPLQSVTRARLNVLAVALLVLTRVSVV
jgi:hypothetical protein